MTTTSWNNIKVARTRIRRHLPGPQVDFSRMQSVAATTKTGSELTRFYNYLSTDIAITIAGDGCLLACGEICGSLRYAEQFVVSTSCPDAVIVK
jgi:hypothetical protein